MGWSMKLVLWLLAADSLWVIISTYRQKWAQLAVGVVLGIIFDLMIMKGLVS